MSKDNKYDGEKDGAGWGRAETASAHDFTVNILWIVDKESFVWRPKEMNSKPWRCIFIKESSKQKEEQIS